MQQQQQKQQPLCAIYHVVLFPDFLQQEAAAVCPVQVYICLLSRWKD